MKYTLSVEASYKLLRTVAAHKVKWGKQASPPYTLAQIMESLEHVVADGGLDPENKTDAAELTKLRRQLAACTNREKGRAAPPKLVIMTGETDAD